jgi:uncharacterized transporter YbjL
MKNRIILILGVLLIPFFGIAQEVSASPDMADAFRRDGKIYVVITVLAIIFICLIGYLISIDLKLRKLENKN